MPFIDRGARKRARYLRDLSIKSYKESKATEHDPHSHSWLDNELTTKGHKKNIIRWQGNYESAGGRAPKKTKKKQARRKAAHTGHKRSGPKAFRTGWKF